MQYVRIIAKPTPEHRDASPFCVDAIIDDEGRILGRHALLGLAGYFHTRDEHFYPFVLDPNGRVDFGKGYAEQGSERYATVDLREDVVRTGRMLTWDSQNYGVTQYRITDIQILPA
jgi:hypothetical protein